jgi:hypothetical protein
VLLYDHRQSPNRDAGEIPALIAEGLAKGGRVTETFQLSDYAQAVQEAWKHRQAGDLIVIQTGLVDGLAELAAQLGWPAIVQHGDPATNHLGASAGPQGVRS